MSSNDISIKVENISKIYRIGMKREIQENFTSALLEFIKSPWKNYRKYRSLYRFDDIKQNDIQNSNDTPSDIIRAVNDVSFEVDRGEVLGLIGRNGAGKSTLLKILCRITEPTTGHARMRGRISSLLEVGTGFHPELTGRENVYLNGTVLGMKKVEIDRKFDEIVDFSGVEKFIDTPVKRYSSGMKVRLAFAVAAHLEPEILLVDEVLAVGDVEFQKKCLNKMQDVGQRGRTIIFVSHNMPAITRLCERAILLEDGRIIEDGPSKQVVANYMSSSTGVVSSKVWNDPATAPKGPVARLIAVRAKNENDEVNDFFDICKPVIIEMEYEILKPGYIAMPHFGLRNEFGDAIFITIDQDPNWQNRPRPMGKYVSRVVIPGNLMAESTIFVNCNLMTLNPNEVQFSERSAISFVIADTFESDSARGNYLGTKFPGVVRPLLDWSTDFSPAN
jgi:lipopolysaccharide transport system ATP-binding protein